MPRRIRPWVIEPLWYLRSISYSEYRQTGWWRSRRQRFIDERPGGKRHWCDLCGMWWEIRLLSLEINDGIDLWDEIPRWHVHHLSYDHLGDEPDEDLAYLCGPCHHLVHFPTAQQAREWCELRGWELAEKASEFRTSWDTEEIQAASDDDGIPF